MFSCYGLCRSTRGCRSGTSVAAFVYEQRRYDVARKCLHEYVCLCTSTLRRALLFTAAEHLSHTAHHLSSQSRQPACQTCQLDRLVVDVNDCDSGVLKASVCLFRGFHWHGWGRGRCWWAFVQIYCFRVEAVGREDAVTLLSVYSGPVVIPVELHLFALPREANAAEAEVSDFALTIV